MKKITKKFSLQLLASSLLLGGAMSSASAAESTLDKVRSAGVLKCGVSTGIPGFSNTDSKGNWEGIDVEYCRALAAGVLGDAKKVKFIPLTAKERFTALQSGEIDVLSGGNFHGEPLAIAMDYLGLAMSEIGNMSERRIMRLIDEASNTQTLPAFLTKNGGLNSGFMIMQYTAAALATESKVLSHPASVDTIPTSANVEDHVSMGVTAGLKARRINSNVERILGLELMTAAQGIDFRREVMDSPQLGQGTQPVYDAIREHVPFIEEDTVMYPYIESVHEMVTQGTIAKISTIQTA